ncbi:MAG: hypothetical protein NVSMB65_17750 [Chloroflexota bacterium]
MSTRSGRRDSATAVADMGEGDVAFQRFGGAAALTVAVCTLAYALAFYFLPEAQKHAPAQALPDFAQRPAARLGMCTVLGLGYLAGSVVAVALYQRVRGRQPGWALWSMLLGVIGCAMGVLHATYFAYQLLSLSLLYTTGDAALKAGAVAAAITPSPVGFGNVVLMGAWLLTTGVLMARTPYFPRLLGYMAALAGALALWLLLVGVIGHLQGPLAPLLNLVLVLAGPVAWVWTGIIFWTRP